jgi:hypothetical protein
MSLELAKSAIDAADKGDIEQAEGILAEYFSEARVGYQLGRMRHLEAFQLRLSLAEKALRTMQPAAIKRAYP